MFRITFADQQCLDIKLSRHDGKLDYRYHTSDNHFLYMPALRDTAHLCELIKRHGDGSLPDTIRQIAEHDWCLAAAVAIETGSALPPVNNTTDAIELVTLTVLAGNHDIFLTQKIPMSIWLSILSGRFFYISDDYAAEGELFDCGWHFEDGELTLDGEDGMRLFKDRVNYIWRILGWQFGPKNLPTHLLTRQQELRTLLSEREKAEAEEALRMEDYAAFLARIDAIVKNDQECRRIESTLTWREALQLYEEKLGTPAPLWTDPLAPAHVLFPSVAIRILTTAVKSGKTLPTSFYIPDSAFVPAKDLEKGYVAAYEVLQAKLRLAPDKVTLNDLPANTTEANLPNDTAEGIMSWPLDALRNADGDIEAYWLPPITHKTDDPNADAWEKPQISFVEAFRRGDRQALRALDPDGLLRFDRSDRAWFTTSYGKEFLNQHAVSITTLNAKLTARLKVGEKNPSEVLSSQQQILDVCNREREDALLSEEPYPHFEMDSVWLELNALDRNRPDDAAFWSFRLPEEPSINAGQFFGDRYCAATIDDYAINVCAEIRTAVRDFKRLAIAAEPLPVGLPFTTVEKLLTSLGIKFETPSIRHAYVSQHRRVGWIDEKKMKALPKAAEKAVRECRHAFSEIHRQDLLKRIGALTAEVARLSGRETRTERQNAKRILPNSERAMTRLLGLSSSERTAVEPFIVGPFVSDGIRVIVATHVSGVPIPAGLYGALENRIGEAVPVKLERIVGIDRHLDIPKSREDWDRCWLSAAGSAETPDFRITIDMSQNAERIRGVISRALNDEACGTLEFVVR